MPIWVDILAIFFGAGSIVYLIVEKLFMRRQDKADAQAKEIENASNAAHLYNEIDEIVKSKTAPIEAKLDKALSELDTIRRRWCCYRQECNDRILYDDDLDDLDQGDKPTESNE